MTTNRPEPSKPRPLALTPATIDELTERPLLVLPERVRPAAFALWACNRHLKDFESAFPITAPLAHWIARYRLAEADAVAVLEAMLSPAAMARYRYASDLTTDLAERVEAKLKQRRQEERDRAARDDAARRADEARAAGVRPATAEEIRAMRDRVAGVGFSNPNE